MNPNHKEQTLEFTRPKSWAARVRDPFVKRWAELEYRDPAWLLGFTRWAQENLGEGLSEKDLDLPFREIAGIREARQAALLAFAMSMVTGMEVRFAMHEHADYDAVFCTRLSREQVSWHSVQLKELVPRHVNQNARLPDLLSRLKKYRDSSELLVGIHINRDIDDSEFDSIPAQDLNLAAIFLYGSLNKTKWYVYGSLLSPREERGMIPFELPVLTEEEAMRGPPPPRHLWEGSPADTPRDWDSHGPS